MADDLAPDTGDVKVPPMFPRMTKLKRGETVMFSYVVFRSKADRDRINKKVINDPRLAEMMDSKATSFDVKRRAYSGFKVLVDE